MDLFTNIGFLVLKDIANGVLGKYHTNSKSIEIQLMQTFLNDMHLRSLADSDIASVHQDAFENLLNSKVDRAFNETVFGQHEYLSGYMPTFSEGAITRFFLFLDQSCLRFVPPYVIQKFDSHLFVDVIKLFYPMLFHWRYQFSAADMKLYSGGQNV